MSPHAVLGVLALAAAATAPAGQPMGIVKVSPDGRGFVDSLTGERFVPFGVNYSIPEAGRRIWRLFRAKHVERDCRHMKTLGANVFRMFLTTASFMPEEGVVSEEALGKTDALFEIARRHGLRVILSGPDWWEGGTEFWPLGSHSSFGFYSERHLRDIENFWRVFAGRCRDEPALFAYSIKNEPRIPWALPAEQWQRFLKEKYGDVERLAAAWGEEIEEWEDIERPPNEDREYDQALYDYQLFREHVARRWVERQVRAIRSADPDHMVTHSGIQWDVPLFRGWPPRPGGYTGFDIHNISDLLDYVSIHWYGIRPSHLRSEAKFRPLGMAWLEEVLAYVSVGKPVVFEECSPRTLADARYLDVARRYCSGALFWEYWRVVQRRGPNDWAVKAMNRAREVIERSRPLDLSRAEVWVIDKRRLLTWYGGELREDPWWLRRTGRSRWNDTGGFWTDFFMTLRARGRPLRIELVDMRERGR